MRKTYNKPVLYAESFELLEHIASCRVDGLGTDSKVYATFKDGSATGDCTFVDANITLFYNNNCDLDLFDDGDYDVSHLGLDCYNAFSTPNTLFSS